MNPQSLFVLFGLNLLLAVSLACGQSVPALELSPGTEPPPQSQTMPPATVGDVTHSLSYGGQERTYILHIPSSYDAARPTPLVIVFHGFGLNAEEMIRITGFNVQADARGFLVVYPNGSGRTSSWNGGDCCGEAAIKQVDDVGFVGALIEELAKSFNLDARRVYAAGFSNGAIMAYRLACDLPE
jgi:polyhydroxybutyrate depolymerase